jgi:hypothetical protein
VVTSNSNVQINQLRSQSDNYLKGFPQDVDVKISGSFRIRIQGKHEELSPHDLPEAITTLLARRGCESRFCVQHITRRNLIHVEYCDIHSQLEEGHKGYGYVCKLKTYKCQMTELKRYFNFDAPLNGR